MSGRHCPHCGGWLPNIPVPEDWREQLLSRSSELGIESLLRSISSEDALRIWVGLRQIDP